MRFAAHSLYLSLISILLLVPCLSWSKTPSCYPVPFDHFWFRVDAATYKQLGESSYFGDERFSYFEPNKKPWGTHYGHYITGNLHHLEVFDEYMPTRSEPLGIAFLSENPGCLAEIHERLNKLGKPFLMQPDADWGRFTELEKNKSVAIWVAELKPAYVGAPDGAIDRSAWIARMKKMNGDTSDGNHNFQKIKEVVWRLNGSDAQFLGKVLTVLGWKKKSRRAYVLDGTKVVLEVLTGALPVQGLKSLTLELQRPYKSIEIGKFRSVSTERPAQVTFEIR